MTAPFYLTLFLLCNTIIVSTIHTTVNVINTFFDIKDKENFIPTSFNYETATISTTDGIIKGAPTWNNVKYIKYLHCQLGKPKYVIMFRIWQKKYKKKLSVSENM